VPHTYANLLVHVIFGTKGRRPTITADVRPRLFAYMGGVVREAGGTPTIVNGTDDHAHLLLGLPATASVADVLRVVKANSSRWVHETFPALRAFAWQSGYAAFSVSQSNADAVRAYIAGQEEHHRHVSFREEYIQFLERHGIAYDERYVWE
jgi:REP element-mobilizing transposase RayT